MLIDTQICKAKTTEKPQRLSDSNGLYFQKALKWWRLDYRINCKRNTFYPSYRTEYIISA